MVINHGMIRKPMRMSFMVDAYNMSKQWSPYANYAWCFCFDPQMCSSSSAVSRTLVQNCINCYECRTCDYNNIMLFTDF